MSKRKRELTHEQLYKFVDNFGEMSEDDWEPFEGTDSDQLFQYGSESQTSSTSYLGCCTSVTFKKWFSI